jgi:hypothetical protein
MKFLKKFGTVWAIASFSNFQKWIEYRFQSEPTKEGLLVLLVIKVPWRERIDTFGFAKVHWN